MARTGVGDDESFRTAFGRHYGDITRYAMRRSAASDVDGVVAEVFVIAWKHWQRRPSLDAEILPWLYGISRNVVRNHHRALRRRAAIALVANQPTVLEPELSTPPTWILNALANLAPNDQEVLRLHAWEGLSGRELALALRTNETAARVRLYRARKRLRQQLDSHRTSAPTSIQAH